MTPVAKPETDCSAFCKRFCKLEIALEGVVVFAEKRAVASIDVDVARDPEQEVVEERTAAPIVERLTNAKTGEVSLFPEIEIDSWWTNIDCTEEECIAGYHDHGTSEQFHSELKTDMNIEKLPSGKFATNALILLYRQLT